MFSNHEELTCEVCGEIFMGRKPAEGGLIICAKCLSVAELPVVNDGDNIPDTVHDEVAFGGGENA